MGRGVIHLSCLPEVLENLELLAQTTLMILKFWVFLERGEFQLSFCNFRLSVGYISVDILDEIKINKRKN